MPQGMGKAGGYGQWGFTWRSTVSFSAALPTPSRQSHQRLDKLTCLSAGRPPAAAARPDVLDNTETAGGREGNIHAGRLTMNHEWNGDEG